MNDKISNNNQQNIAQTTQTATKQAPTNHPLFALATIIMAVGVGLGAFGAHGLAHFNPGFVPTWQTATLYWLVHGLGLLLLATHNLRVGYWLIATGILLFSGSLYVMAFVNIGKFAMITPLGGLLLSTGWMLAAMEVLVRIKRIKPSQTQ